MLMWPRDVGRQLDKPDRHAGEGVGRQDGALTHFRLQGGESLEVELHVRLCVCRVRPEEAAAVVDGQAERAGAEQDVLQANLELAPPRAQLVVQRRHLHAVGVVDADMVFEVVPDVCICNTHWNAMLCSKFGRADAGQLQELR
jgi:hypothetical protein